MELLAVGCDWWLREKDNDGLLVWWNRKVFYILYEGEGNAGVLCIYGIWMLHDIGRIDGEDGWNSGVR